MFISEKKIKDVNRTLFIYIGITVLTVLFSVIYEINSNNVYSADMAFAWVYPLVLGVGMYLAIRFVPSSIVPGLLPACVYATGVGLATARSIFLGVINIYGTTNRVMTIIYTILVWFFVVSGFISYLIILIYGMVNRHKNAETQ